MIQTNPNPKMTAREIKEFRDNFSKCVSGNFTPEEKRQIDIRIKRMNSIGKKILAKNNGKNPILGY